MLGAHRPIVRTLLSTGTQNVRKHHASDEERRRDHNSQSSSRAVTPYSGTDKNDKNERQRWTTNDKSKLAESRGNAGLTINSTTRRRIESDPQRAKGEHCREN